MHYTIELPDALEQQLTQTSALLQRKKSDLVLEALQDYLARQTFVAEAQRQSREASAAPNPDADAWHDETDNLDAQ